MPHAEDTGRPLEDAKTQESISEKESKYDSKLKVVMTDGTVNYVDRKAIGGDAQEMPEGYFTSLAFILTVLGQCLGVICAYVGWFMPSNTLPLIDADLGNSPLIGWVATSWTLGSSIGFLLFGRLSDIFGRKYLVVGTSVLGLIGYIIGATSQNVPQLIAAELIIGIASAGQLSFGIILGELVPNKWRGPIINVCFLAALPFAVFGPIFARLLIQNTAAGWRWCYYMAIIFSVLAVVINFFFYHPPTYGQLHVGGKSKWQQMKEQDYVGIFLFLVGVILFLIALSWGGTSFPWKSSEVLGTLLVGSATIIAFCLYETYLCKVPPLMPPRLFKVANGGYTAVVIAATIGASVYYSFSVLWPTILSTLYSPNPIDVGIKSSVVGGSILLGQTVGGLTISFVPRVKYQAIFCSAIAFGFVTAMTSISPDNEAKTLALAILGIFFVGIVDNLTFAGVTLVIEPQDIGLATGILGSIRALGGAVAEVLYVSVLDTRLAEVMPSTVGNAAVAAGLPESSVATLLADISTGNFTNVPDINDNIIAAASAGLKEAYAKSFQLVFYVTIPFSAILIIASCFIPDMDTWLTSNVAKKLQKKSTNNEASSDTLEFESA
ncbi:trichothecene efflux pump [Xylariaceae sp. FL0255]|nr:trichothecene efflux pump [Xylariaceae sp. FL0255]